MRNAGTRLSVSIDGEALPAEAFLTAAQEFLAIAAAVEKKLAEKREITWIITKLTRQSPAFLEVKPYSKSNRVALAALGSIVAAAVAKGLYQLEHGEAVPEIFSAHALKSAEKLASLRKKGVTSISIAHYEDGIVVCETPVTERVTAMINDHRAPLHRSFGTVEGKFEAATIHGDPNFGIYDQLTNRRISCIATESKINELIKCAPFGSRLAVFGNVTSDGDGFPTSVVVEDVRVLRERSELPQPRDLIGLYSDMTIRAEDFGDYLRGDKE